METRIAQIAAENVKFMITLILLEIWIVSVFTFGLCLLNWGLWRLIDGKSLISNNIQGLVKACSIMPIAIGWMFIAYFWWRWMIWRCEAIDLADMDNCAD
jgi:hypothetical protein